MDISSPRDAVFYYECSNMKFRLTYFIPPSKMETLIESGDLSAKALRDFPDGIDLTCREYEFEDFKQRYGYRPQFSADAVNRAFYAILTDTRKWKEQRGTGFIREAEMIRHVKKIDSMLKQKKMLPEDIGPLPEKPTLRQRKIWMKKLAIQQSQMHSYLEQMHIEDIDPKKPLQKQELSTIRMKRGKSAEEIFSTLQQKRKR